MWEISAQVGSESIGGRLTSTGFWFQEELMFIYTSKKNIEYS